MQRSEMIKEIERNREKFWNLEQQIWEYPEGALQEEKAAAWTASLLEEAGFEVERGIYGLPTAFRAVWGEGKPSVGFLGEYDALPGLAQTVSTEKEEIEGQKWGHGCCHNLLGVAAAAAAIGLKAELEQSGTKGSVIYYGCPAEETLKGKPVMAARGAFRDLDVVIANHPAFSTEVSYGTTQGCRSFIARFHGTPSHAGLSPELGRSALDALELANVGINFLREHVADDVRMSYIINQGGQAVNIVPEYAEGTYTVRALDSARIDDAFERVRNIMEGAALMTGTKCEIEETGGCYPILNNPILVDLIHQCMEELEQEMEPYTEEELAFAEKISETMPEEAVRRKEKAYGVTKTNPMQTGVRPVGTYDIAGGFDVGDVSHIVPTAFFQNTAYPVGLVAHTWQVSACAGHPMAFKGSMYAAKVMALAGWKLITDRERMEQAEKAFEKQMEGRSYHSYCQDIKEV